MNMPIDISIVIVSYNTRDLLEECLRSIDEHAGAVTVETFVVDNASTDGSPDVVQQQFPHVKVIRNMRNVGFARANNQAIRESSGRYVLLLNPDTIVLDGAIAATAAFMDSQQDAGIVTCEVLNADYSFQTCYGDFFPNLWSMMTGGTTLRVAIASLFMNRQYLASSGVAEQDINSPHPVAWVMGAFMMIRRAVIEHIGMLDENLFMYGEEPDYCYRATLAGWRLWYTPTGRIIHLGGQSTRSVDQAELINWLLTTYFHFFRKHKSKIYTLGCYVVVVASSACKLIMYSMLRPLVANVAKKQRRREKQLQMYHTLQWCLSQNPLHLIRDPTAT